jgi:pyruvate/2-oxoglutarate dehydrogenase complex dihydrolipoamide dehydrogenase (E3) component
MRVQKFDAIIVGSGQAGTPLAFKMASKGKKVAFIEKEHWGGTCVNVGCTPTKAYVASARRMWDAHHGEELGVKIPSGVKADMAKIKQRKDDMIGKSSEGIVSGIENEDNITHFKGEATFSGFKTIKVNGEQLKAGQVFINTGARPLIPEGFEEINFLTNQSILELEELPEHLIIVGGSYIGLEFGQMFRRFGSKVTIIERSDQIIAREDEEISSSILETLKAEGVEFRLNATCTNGKNNKDGTITVSVDCQRGAPEITGTHLLLAVGRKPNTDMLNLEATGLTTNKSGYIEVNDYLETSVQGIYALGDCNGKGAFTHTSYNDYEIVAENMFEGKDRKVSDRIMTYALYVDPPLGRAGMTRKEALAKGCHILEARMPMNRIARAKEKGETKGLMNAIIDADTQEFLGAAVLGVGGDEIVNSMLTLMYAKVPYTVFRDAVISHPTITELIPTMLKSVKEISKS